jgi:DNA polymerase elongation subunit (family B)
MKKIVFDIETRDTFQDAGSNDPADLHISLVGVYDYETDQYTSYLEEELSKLWPLIEKADVLIGFNSDHFDIPLLNKYYPGDLTKIKSVDLLKEIRKSIGRRIGMGYVAQATLGKGKIGHGLEAIAWWQKGEIEKIRKYCLEDVKITKELYEYALKHGKLKYPEGPVVKDITLDTSDWEKKEDSAMTFTLPF